MSSDPAPHWYARHQVPGEPGYVVVGVASDEFADGMVVELPPPVRRPTGWTSEVHVAGTGQLPFRVLISDALSPEAPLLWYVVLPAPEAVSEVDLVTFSTANRAEGDVLDLAAFQAVGIDWSNQVGAMRWDARTGLVRQVYVAPAVRRRGVGTKLGAAAVCLSRVRGWAPMQVDGRRTDLGEAWVSAVRARSWIALPERTSWAPPMTPPEAAAGVPERNLVPDPE
jgi:GNAT superfamily N-acetyltransferase